MKHDSINIIIPVYPPGLLAATVFGMNDHEAQTVWQYVRNFCRSQDGQRWKRGQLQHFAQLARQIRANHNLAELEEDELQTGLALSWFGPTDAGAPPALLREEVLDILRSDVSDPQVRQLRSADVVIAYGCGNWRQPAKGGGSWEHRWPRALGWVTQHVLGWIKATAAWLHFEVQLKGYAFTAPFPSRATADMLSNFLWLGSCDCWRARLSDPEQEVDHRTAQRRARCHREHDLSGWNPAEMALADFIARAVKGDKVRGDRSRRKGFASGAVYQGMFFSDLYRENDIRMGRVLVWRCPQHPDLGLEKDMCLACSEHKVLTTFDETHHSRDVVKRLLVQAPTGPYEEAQYWRCQEGDTYYQTQHPICPLCHRQRTQGAAKSTVWVFSSIQQIEVPHTLSTSQTSQHALDTHLTLMSALKQLEPLECEVVTLIHLQEFSRRQAAQKLSLSTEQLNEILESALEKMREALTEED